MFVISRSSFKVVIILGLRPFTDPFNRKNKKNYRRHNITFQPLLCSADPFNYENNNDKKNK